MISWYCLIASLSSFIELEETLLIHPNAAGQDLHDGACYPLPYTLESTVSLGSLVQTFFLVLLAQKLQRNMFHIFPSVGECEQLMTTLFIAYFTH